MSESVSIIILTYNSLNTVKTHFKGLVDQFSQDLIYIDNGSTDGTVQYIEKLQKKYKNITRKKNNENKGITVAKNQGVKAAKGKYLLILDDDMLIENPAFLKNITDYYKSLEQKGLNPGFVMPLFIDKEELETDRKTRAYGAYYFPFGIIKRRKRVELETVMSHKGPIKIAISQGGAMFIKKAIWEEIGGLDESQLFNLDDDDISTRAMIYGYKNYLYNKEYIIHTGLARRMDPERYAKNDLTYYNGKAKAIVKNFSMITILYMLPLFSGRMFAEAIYHSLYYRYPGILFANIKSMFNFLSELPETLKKRSTIQKNRKVGDREILRLKAPRY